MAGGRDIQCIVVISTHAPAGGATRFGDVDAAGRYAISTHAPAGGATWGLIRIPSTRSLFLLTPLREGRPLSSRFATDLRHHFYSRPCGRGDSRRSWLPHRIPHFYSRPCGRGDETGGRNQQPGNQFLLTPLREGRHEGEPAAYIGSISTHAPAGGATGARTASTENGGLFLLTPLREGRLAVFQLNAGQIGISTHAPAGGATKGRIIWQQKTTYFYSRPCGRGDAERRSQRQRARNFYSRPCGRGDGKLRAVSHHPCAFLLTPLREGRRFLADIIVLQQTFLLTPLREGRLFSAPRAGVWD